jgi:hypothetical protein
LNTGYRPEVATLLYPGMTPLDLLGPQAVLADPANAHWVWNGAR